VMTDRRIACELFIVGVRQPAIELALQAGATAALTSEGVPILALSATPPWLEVVGEAAGTSSGVPAVAAADKAIACACRDVRVSDLKACVAQGFAHPELVKRRTGAMTGFCQGKLCAAAVLAVLRDQGVDPTPTRVRPLARPIALGELAADA
jgi:sarcosine oxidase alpha subunit family protein